MKTVFKNKKIIISSILILCVALAAYVYTQYNALARTGSQLRALEKKALTAPLEIEYAQHKADTFLIVSEKAKQKALKDDQDIYNLSALLQAHLTTLDVIFEKTQDPHLSYIREAVILRIVEIESELVGRSVELMDATESINEMFTSVEATIDRLRSSEGVVNARMFSEAEVSIQQAIFALSEAQSSLDAGLTEDAVRATLRARRLVQEAYYTTELALFIKKHTPEQ